MNILKEVIQNKFLIILLSEAEYEEKLSDIIKQVGKTKSNVCYVCLSNPYTDVIGEFKKKGINTSRFFFIDALSSHYGKSSDADNCIFVSGPNALDEIRDAIIRAVEKKNCSIIIMDTVTSLLIYQQSFSIVKFTHNLLCSTKQENTKKLFVVMKGSGALERENLELAKDIGMFADKTLEI